MSNLLLNLLSNLLLNLLSNLLLILLSNLLLILLSNLLPNLLLILLSNLLPILLSIGKILDIVNVTPDERGIHTTNRSRIEYSNMFITLITKFDEFRKHVQCLLQSRLGFFSNFLHFIF